MSKSNPTIATPKQVREWARTIDLSTVVDGKGNPAPTASILGKSGDGSKVRGRVHPLFNAAYEAAHPGTVVQEKTGLDVKQVEVPLFSPKTGRAVKPVTLPLPEVRRLAGIEGKKGRIPSAALVAAGEAYQKAKGLR